MRDDPVGDVNTLTFDVFGTILDLQATLVPAVGSLLAAGGAPMDAPTVWRVWRDRQRIEQHQDSLMMLGHSGYLETCRRALVYCLRQHGIDFTDADVSSVVDAWKDLDPHFPYQPCMACRHQQRNYPM